MNNPRSILLIALLLVSYLIWNQWQQDYAQPAAVATPATESAPAAGGTPAAVAGSEVPSANASTPADATPAAIPGAAGEAKGDLVEVSNDVLKLWIDTRGATVVRADLLAYPQQPKDYANPVRLLDDSADHYFVAQSGLASAADSAKAASHQDVFAAEQKSYALAADQPKLEVPFTWTDSASGLTVRKVFVLERGSYVLATRQEIKNDGAAAWNGNAYRQLQRVIPPAAKHGFFSSITNPQSYSFRSSPSTSS